jgi:hypothetical protein
MDQPQRPMENSAADQTTELAERRLRRNAYLAVRDISCEFHGGVLTLRGCLPTYHLKQIALTAVAVIEGVERIDDQILVVAPPIA